MTAARRPSSRYATTEHLLGDRIVCAFCGLADHAVQFIAEDLPLCEDCEAHRPDGSEGAGAWLREDG